MDLGGRRSYLNRIAGADLTLSQNASINAAPAGKELLGDSDEFPVDEGAPDGFAGVGEGRHLEQNLVADPESGARNDQIPIDALEGEVLAGGYDVDGMAFSLECVDYFQRIDADGSFGSAVVFYVVLRVTIDARSRHLHNSYTLFRNAAA